MALVGAVARASVVAVAAITVTSMGVVENGRGWHGSKSALGGKMTELTEAVNAATATALGYDDVDALREAASGKFLFDLAAEKDVTIEQLEQARRTAAQPILDGLVNDETLTREQADQLLERVVKVHEPSAMQRAHIAVGQATREATATKLGYDSTEALAEGLKEKSLRALAVEQGVTPEQLQMAQQEAAETALDNLVSAGTITREEADSYLVQLAWSRSGRGRSKGGRRGGRGQRGHDGRRGYGQGGRGRSDSKKRDKDSMPSETPTPSATPASGSTA